VFKITTVFNNTICFYSHLLNRTNNKSWTETYECCDAMDSLLCQKMYYDFKAGKRDYPELLLTCDCWFDDCDPNNQSKKNRGSVFIRTVTISPPKGNRNSIKNTYPYAIGPKSTDRSIVDSRFQKEMKAINEKDSNGSRKKFFYKMVNGEVYVTLRLLSKSADQPERRAALGLSGGNSNLHTRFGLISGLNERCVHIAPCANCQEKQYAGDRDWDSGSCAFCTQWEMEGNHLLLRFKVPKGYPQSELDNDEKSTKKMKPKRISLKGLKRSYELATEKLVLNKWNEDTCRVYLKTCGINDKSVNSIISYAKGLKAIGMDNPEGVEGLSQNMGGVSQDDINMTEAKLLGGVTPYPAGWDDDIIFFQNLDIPMHLLFLGIVQTVLDLTFRWCKQKRQYTDVMRKTKGKYYSVSDMIPNNAIWVPNNILLVQLQHIFH
jgi:hypothetical protein